MENATTIEEAVKLMTAPQEQPEAEVEAVEVEAEAEEVVIEDMETEEPTLEAESYDDDMDYDDVELDDTEIEAEVPEETNLIPVKVNGKEEMWTLDQLKQSAAGQGYINQRMQEIAQVEKQYKEQAQQLAQQQQQVLRMYQQAQQVGVQPPVPPTTELFDKDPIGYMEQKIKYDEAKQQYDAQVQQVQQLQRQQQAATEQQRMQFLAQQAEVLKQHIPDIADPEKGAAIKADLVKTGTHYGFSEAEIQGVTDARYVRALNDAMKWRRLQDKKRAATRGEPAKTVVKAGAKRRASEGQSATRKKQEQKLRKSGRIEDALSLMLKP